MAIGTDKKMDVAEYYARRAEMQDLVVRGIITQDIMDGAMENVARENGLLGIVDVIPKQYQRKESAERTITILPANPNMKATSPPEFPAPTLNPAHVLDSKGIGVETLSEPSIPKYISLTDLAGSYRIENPSYVIQSWMRSENTLAFLDLWEQENNPAYDASAYAILLEKKKYTSFTVTAKQWIEKTKAIGITSKQGKQGGTYAHPIIAGQFATWLSPKYMMRVLKMAEDKADFFEEDI